MSHEWGVIAMLKVFWKHGVREFLETRYQECWSVWVPMDVLTAGLILCRWSIKQWAERVMKGKIWKRKWLEWNAWENLISRCSEWKKNYHTCKISFIFVINEAPGCLGPPPRLLFGLPWEVSVEGSMCADLLIIWYWNKIESFKTHLIPEREIIIEINSFRRQKHWFFVKQERML